jgi:prepilin-type N-terminal cleavage/methylation domain-containing protein
MVKIYKKAFTLIELVTVIAIIGLLSTVAIVVTGSSRAKAKLAAGQGFETAVYHAVGDQLIGEWLFDEGSGTTARDTSGNGRDGSLAAATWTTGIKGGALTFNNSGYVSLGTDAALNPSVFTITAWIKPGDFSGSYNYIYSNARDCCGAYKGLNFFLYQNILAGTIWNTGAASISSIAKISNDPVWTFVAFSYDGNKMSLYINGHLDNTYATTLGVGSPAQTGNYIGALAPYAGGLGFVGSIDQVRIYGGAVVAANIEKMYLAEKDRFLTRK